MIKRRIVCLLLTVTLLTGLAGLKVSAMETSNSGNALECIGLDAQHSFLGNTALIDNAESVILYETNSDILMYAWNADARIYPASLVKVMTALLAIEQGRLTDVVVVKEDVLNVLPGSFVNLEYTLSNGTCVKFLDDNATYLGNQLPCEFGGNRCFGIVANMEFLLVCTYEENGANPELVIYKKR